MSTISKVVRYENEEEFLREMDEVLERFTYLASRYGSGNVVEGFLLWDYIGIRDYEGIKVFRLGEFPYVEGALKIEIEKLRIMERYFDEMESKRDEITTEEIAYFVKMMNEELGVDLVFYEAYDLGLNRNDAYLIINVKALNYLEHVVDAEDREIFEDAVRLLMALI
ncbi:MAG: hypothetical protein J7K57_00575 [Palaeococcus sp.]|uniref:hypothetical protein n=1 Tax=Palaeococcus sp. (in: euryarchaeotes) TaxID=2820298 RepID=UPI0025F89B94|nr:hypothetical protein [Palaeococcus sp. (in: euryarchaeotes)]MCD6558369.1 hypothetical protein [Palaeococcus sp. (in: euryarchaeotes)]